MGQIDILGRMPKDAEVSPWWDDTFYEHGTQALIDTMDLVQNVILQTEYHLSQAQVETNLARKTAQIMSSSSTRSARTAVGIPGGTGYFEVAQLEAHSSSPSRYSNVAISDTSSDQ